MAKSMWYRLLIIGMAFLLIETPAYAAAGIEAVTVTTGKQGAQTYTVTIQILALMTLLTVLPALLLTMTSFTRIMIVLSLLRTALGTGSAPSNQVLLGLSMFLTIFIMMPVFDKVNAEAVQPYLEEKIDVTVAIEKASEPFRQFMLKQTREADLELFIRISG
ncbi:MAG: flagellar biosynthetic protein FliP, partial [Methylobacter sp.]